MRADDTDWEGLPADNRGGRFAALLRSYRRLAGLSQEALAARAGVSVRAVSGMERAEGHVPYAATLRLLADALALSPTERDAFIAAARPAGPRLAAPDAPYVPFGEWRPSVPRALRLMSRLPTPLSPLIGRVSALADARALLRQPGTRLLTITGAPGVGKTSFARRLVASLEPDAFPDGVAYIDLSPLTDHALMLPTLAESLEVGGPTQWTSTERLVAALSGRQALLLPDTFERMLAAGPELLALLEACEGLTAVVTSRTPLGQPGEHEFPLAPLALPAQRAVSDAAPTFDEAALATLRAAPAVALFVERARSARPDFTLTGANAASVAALCRRLDGLPLAIELAAARIPLASPQATLEWLDQLFTQPAVNQPRQPSRYGHRDWLGALHGAITWSYDLLTPVEQWVFRRLAVFEGGATLEAAEAVCLRSTTSEVAPVSPIGEPDVPLDSLMSLTRQNLLIVEPQSDVEGGAPARLRLLDTIRAVAWERLWVSGEAPQTQHAHARYYLAVAEDATRRFRQGAPGVWEPLAPELANLRAALTWAVHQHDTGAAILGLRLATALGPLWYALGLTGEGLRWVDELLAQVHPDGGVHAHPGGAPQTPAPGFLRLQAQAHYMAGWLALDQGMLQRAVESLTSSVGAFRTVYDATDARASGVGNGALLDQAAAVGEAPTQADDDATALGDALNRLGDALWRQGRTASAEAVFEESLELRRRVGDAEAIVHSLNNLAAVAAARGHLDVAQRLLAACLAQARQMASQDGEIGALCALASIAERQARAAQAAALLDEALVVAEVRGADDMTAYILGRQGDLARRQGDLALAEARWQASLATPPTGAATGHYASALAWLALGDVARDAGRNTEAMDRYPPELAHLPRGHGSGWRGRLYGAHRRAGHCTGALRRRDPPLWDRRRHALAAWLSVGSR